MLSSDFLQAMTQVLDFGGQKLQLKATDVLISVVQHDPVPLREYLLREKPAKSASRQGMQNPLFQHLMRYLPKSPILNRKANVPALFIPHFSHTAFLGIALTAQLVEIGSALI